MESKASSQLPRSEPSQGLSAGQSCLQGSDALIKQETLRKLDKWGKQCPVRLVAQCLQLVQAKELAASSTVCKSWYLPPNLANALWKRCYLADYEAETANDPAIAVEGEDTSWSVRYRRRTRVERNWSSKSFVRSEVALEVHVSLLSSL